MSTPDARRIDDLVRSAQDAMARGAIDVAMRGWDQVLALDPNHPRALTFKGHHMLRSGDPARARQMLERATTVAPNDSMAWLYLAFVHRATGDAGAEGTALQRALTADPYNFVALLSQAVLTERMGHKREAARLFKGVLQLAPPEDRLPPDMRASLAKGRALIAEEEQALRMFLDSRVASLGSDARSVRMEEAKNALAGDRKIYKSEASLLHVPRLPAIPYFERNDFPWFAELEAETGAIREELLGLLRARKGDFQPYMQYPPGAPLNQWVELNNSPRWSALFLWKAGKIVEENAALCPRTMAAFSRVPLAQIANGEPSVMFSALEPHTHIPAHAGITNARAVVHLPIIVPDNCRFRVGPETRVWKEGDLWAFDDTIEHEAWNDSDQLRVIMIFNVWNPFLTEAEREACAALITGYYEYYGETQPF